MAGQTYPRDGIEHVVVDGESTDRSAELARAAGARVLVGRDGSLYEALNKGIREARGEFVVWLNADDLLLPDAVLRVVEAARAAPAAELVVGDYELLDGERREVVHSPRGALEVIRNGKRGRAWVVPLVAVFRTATLRALGPYSTRHKVMGDLDMWLRAAARTPPRAIAEVDAGGVLGVFRVHPASLSVGGGGEERNPAGDRGGVAGLDGGSRGTAGSPGFRALPPPAERLRARRAPGPRPAGLAP